MILIIVYLIFIPWAIGQYEYIRIRKSYPKYIQIGKLERMVERYPDIYALNYLSHLQLTDGRVNAAQKTLNILERAIPYYRNLENKKRFLLNLKRRRNVK